MSYVQRVLQPGETIHHVASLHWIAYFWGSLFFVLALATLIYGEFISNQRMWFWQLGAAALGIISIVLLVPELWKWWTTEIAVTNRRVIYKKRLLSLNPASFLRVETNEMQMDKIESVKVDQPLLGQLLNYGTITILGTGSGRDPIDLVANPIELRNQISAADPSHVKAST